MTRKGTPAPLSAVEIAAETARTRARMSRSLAKLDQRYALRHIVVRATRLVRDAEKIELPKWDAMRRDAPPLALIALGLGWLSVAGRGDGTAVIRQVSAALEHLRLVAQDFGLLSPRDKAPPSLPQS